MVKITNYDKGIIKMDMVNRDKKHKMIKKLLLKAIEKDSVVQIKKCMGMLSNRKCEIYEELANNKVI